MVVILSQDFDANHRYLEKFQNRTDLRIMKGQRIADNHIYIYIIYIYISYIHIYIYIIYIYIIYTYIYIYISYIYIYISYIYIYIIYIYIYIIYIYISYIYISYIKLRTKIVCCSIFHVRIERGEALTLDVFIKESKQLVTAHGQHLLFDHFDHCPLTTRRFFGKVPAQNCSRCTP